MGRDPGAQWRCPPQNKIRIACNMPSKRCVPPKKLETVNRSIVAHISQAPQRLSSVDVERFLQSRFGLTRLQARAVVRNLIRTGELAYTYEHGTSFLEISFRRPVRVGQRVVLVPAGLPYKPAGEEVAVCIAAGASFGSGRHPTTRLAVRGIEQSLVSPASSALPPDSVVLDIGTGSGVLAIAAVKLGAGRGLGIDTDPCARYEARKNIELNRLGSKIRISDLPIEKLKPTGRYQLVVANLRTPSLLHLASRICRLTRVKGRIVLSGIRTRELERLAKPFKANRCSIVWEAEESGWHAVVYQKEDG